MSDSNQRLIAWQIKTDTGRVKETLDSLRAGPRQPTCVSSSTAT